MTLKNKEYILTDEKKKIIEEAYERFNYPEATKLLKLLADTNIKKGRDRSFLSRTRRTTDLSTSESNIESAPRIHHGTLSF